VRTSHALVAAFAIVTPEQNKWSGTMLTEIWHLTFVCLTLGNPACVKMDGLWGCCHERGSIEYAFKYTSEEKCVSGAEWHAEREWNEHKIKLEYYCEKAATWEPYVPTRRYRKPAGGS
jgi:hypothetical protein